MVLVNSTRQTSLADQCRFANTVIKRMVGLLSRSHLDPGEGLLIDRCYGIHTIGMRFPIDVLFLDKELRVIRTVPALPPFRTCAVRHAVYALELPVGVIAQSATETGDQIQIQVRNVADSTTSLSPMAAAKAQA
jgi:uncharacterized membrane protein (UPF0127 family)